MISDNQNLKWFQINRVCNGCWYLFCMVYHLHFSRFNVVMAVSGYGTRVLQVIWAAVFQPILDLGDDGEVPGVDDSVVQILTEIVLMFQLTPITITILTVALQSNSSKASTWFCNIGIVLRSLSPFISLSAPPSFLQQYRHISHFTILIHDH